MSFYCLSEECKTVGGASPNVDCVFPFAFDNKVHYSCIYDSSTDGHPWCSTKVDSKGCHIGGQGNWGICGPNCFKGIDDQSYKKSIHNLIDK